MKQWKLSPYPKQLFFPFLYVLEHQFYIQINKIEYSIKHLISLLLSITFL